MRSVRKRQGETYNRHRTFHLADRKDSIAERERDRRDQTLTPRQVPTLIVGSYISCFFPASLGVFTASEIYSETLHKSPGSNPRALDANRSV